MTILTGFVKSHTRNHTLTHEVIHPETFTQPYFQTLGGEAGNVSIQPIGAFKYG